MKSNVQLYVIILTIMTAGLMITSCKSKNPETEMTKEATQMETYPLHVDEDAAVQEILVSQADMLLSGKEIELPFPYEVLDSCKGDLDSDGTDDLAVVIQEKTEYGFYEGRTIYILMGQQDCSYKITSKNASLIGDSRSGGAFGDSYDNITISNGLLKIFVYGGSSLRWGYTYGFAMARQRLVLTSIESVSISTATANGIITVTDIQSCTALAKTLESELFPELLIYSGTLETDGMPLDFQDYSGQVPPKSEPARLPSLGSYEFGRYLEHGSLKIPANEALDLIKSSNYPDMESIPLPYSKEIMDNYLKLLGVPIPEYYYSDGKDELYYYGIRNDEEMDTHVIAVLTEDGDMGYYMVSDSGEILPDDSFNR